ncbi:MAG: hypothetical protein IKU15_04810 [Clostridia bacterium]|nr:hypothetical protein [Clostridia bacterium]
MKEISYKVESYVYSPTKDTSLDYDKIKYEREVVKYLISNMNKDELCSGEKTLETPEFLTNGKGWVEFAK